MKKLSVLIALSMLSFTSFSIAEDYEIDFATARNIDEQITPKINKAEKQKRLQQGKELYGQVCYDCHSTGFNGAPRLGNYEDWKKVRHFGKVALLESVIIGKGLMPRQGGSADRSETRYRLMIEYMLSTVAAEDIQTTQKTWDESKIARHLSNGKALYDMVCVDCHATGANGAPKLSDKAAWKPRAEKGLDTLVKGAIEGHGNMLPLGGSAIRSIEGVREMVAYMLDTVGYKSKK